MRWIACLIGCLVSGAAAAATLQVSPIRISISPDGKAGVVRLHNQSDASSLVQVEALSWNDTTDLTEVPRTNGVRSCHLDEYDFRTALGPGCADTIDS